MMGVMWKKRYDLINIQGMVGLVYIFVFRAKVGRHVCVFVLRRATLIILVSIKYRVLFLRRL